ncbi:CcdB family protein [Roseivivax sp. THAF197b]|uniref:CcdB family protein n=1 Tax=Roseivivax sp. THAF197b TaxID=2588299 RepID=UPI001269292A|nr:CcdB family protein [Roseivivax sp. THAF197b]QFS84802.1 Toxin CcdB [Roseivivax sp. THAF197b]
MAQFHVYRIALDRLVLDLQIDLVDTGSRVVAPLVPVVGGPQVIGRLEPVFEIEGVDHALHTAEMAAIPSALLRGVPIRDLSEFDYVIRGALDMVFSGF